MKITATIITLNEERNIARAIESLRCCDEILVWIAARPTAPWSWPKSWARACWKPAGAAMPAQKNWAAEQAAHDWILSLDADEALSEALEAEIWSLKKTGPEVRRLHHAAPGALSGPLDSAQRLVSRPQGAALQPPR
jgi:hypothetical protein